MIFQQYHKAKKTIDSLSDNHRLLLSPDVQNIAITAGEILSRQNQFELHAQCGNCQKSCCVSEPRELSLRGFDLILREDWFYILLSVNEETRLQIDHLARQVADLGQCPLLSKTGCILPLTIKPSACIAYDCTSLSDTENDNAELRILLKELERKLKSMNFLIDRAH